MEMHCSQYRYSHFIVYMLRPLFPKPIATLAKEWSNKGSFKVHT